MTLSGVHHVAFISNDMKAQIEFYTEVCGMKLVAIFPMHGVEGATHCFIEVGKDTYMSFVQIKGVNIEPIYGVSHPVDITNPVAGGAMQHIALKLDSLEDMLAMRDRLRSHGYGVFGPFEHGMTQSMYLGAPEGMLLEFATVDTCESVRTEEWVVSESAAAVGISKEELARYVNPSAFDGKGGAIPQPGNDALIYPTPIPRPMFEQLGYLTDKELKQAFHFEKPAEVAE